MATNLPKIAKKPTPLSFEAPLQRTPANIRIKVMSLETGIPGLHFCRRQYGCYSSKIFVVGSERHM